MLAALLRPATATILVIIVLAVIGVYEFTRQRLIRYRAREMTRILKDAKDSYVRGLTGLQDMAGVVTGLPEVPMTFVRRGVGLLDTYAGTATSFKNMLRNIRTMSRDRALRHMTRELLTLQGQETVFQKFQAEVLRVASIQAVGQ